MTDGWTDSYKTAMRDFMERRGQKVDINSSYGSDDSANVYGWADYESCKHVSVTPALSLM